MLSLPTLKISHICHLDNIAKMLRWRHRPNLLMQNSEFEEFQCILVITCPNVQEVIEEVILEKM